MTRAEARSGGRIAHERRATNSRRKTPALALALLLAVLTRSILRIARRLLIGQKLDQLVRIFALLCFGGSLGFFSFAALALLPGLVAMSTRLAICELALAAALAVETTQVAEFVTSHVA